MGPRPSLNSFLAQAKSHVKLPLSVHRKPLTFVVGNESADLDSLCSAIVLAYLRSSVSPHVLHIPLSNLPQPDLSLRTELTAVLRHAGLSPSDILTLSDIPDLKPEETRWYLVDHNSLTGPLQKFSDQVVGCIDHHVDEGVVKKDASPRVIQPCGSCMSLVIDESRELWNELSKQEMEDGSSTAQADDNLARLALAPVLVDTINMTSKDKVREADTEAVSFIQKKISDSKFDSTKFWEEIEAVKQDISGLSFRDILRKDYKEWTEGSLKVGISCVVQNFDYLIEKEDSSAKKVVEGFEQWATERNLDLAAIMTTSHVNDEFQRHLLVWGLNSQGRAALSKFDDIAGSLELKSWGDGKLDEGKHRLTWRQHNLAASRKQVAPLLRQAMTEIGSKSNI